MVSTRMHRHVPRRIVVVVASFLAACGLLVVLAAGFGRDPNAIRSPLLGQAAPAFRLRSLDGRVLSLQALRGHPVLVNFWASWCTGCNVEHPYLVNAWQQYRRRGLRIVGVLYQDTAPDARTFLAQNGGGWPTVVDPGQTTAINFGVYGVPETFFIDRRGVIRYKSTGAVTPALLRAEIPRLMG
jgi:cytochrome c biogenesis protein CcmG/thiol:disulfide interchange protein DsbE